MNLKFPFDTNVQTVHFQFLERGSDAAYAMKQPTGGFYGLLSFTRMVPDVKSSTQYKQKRIKYSITNDTTVYDFVQAASTQRLAYLCDSSGTPLAEPDPDNSSRNNSKTLLRCLDGVRFVDATNGVAYCFYFLGDRCSPSEKQYAAEIDKRREHAKLHEPLNSWDDVLMVQYRNQQLQFNSATPTSWSGQLKLKLGLENKQESAKKAKAASIKLQLEQARKFLTAPHVHALVSNSIHHLPAEVQQLWRDVAFDVECQQLDTNVLPFDGIVSICNAAHDLLVSSKG